MRSLWNRLIALFQRDRIDRDLDEELRIHAAFAREALEYEGMDADAARAAAGRRLGSTLQLRERGRDAWTIVPIDTVLQDLRHACRLLQRHASYSIPAIGTLALGIGLTTAIFSIVYALLLQPLPYRDPSRLIALLPTQAAADGQPSRIVTWTPPDFQDVRAAREATEDVAAYTATMTNLTGRGGPLHLGAVEVTPNFFDLLGVTAARGRTFSGAADDARTVVISDRFWRGTFGADPSLIGQPLTIGGLPHTVIGIMPPAFTFQTSTFAPDNAADVWLPNAWIGGTRGNAFLQLIARRRADLSLTQTNAALAQVAERLSLLQPPTRRTHIIATPLQEHIVAPARRLVLIFAGAVGFVLLIACVNVASLQLARLAARRHELSLRAALGAGRRRIARQLLTEAILLALAGGTLGVLLAYVTLPLLVSMLPAGRLPRHTEIAVSLPVLAFALAASLAAGVGLGLLPALRSSRADADDLRAGSSRTTAPHASTRTRALLVSTQVALTLVLLIGAALLLRSFVSLLQVRPGFDTRNLQSASLFLPEETYATPARMHAFARRTLEQVRALPGVDAASAVNFHPAGANYLNGDFQVEGRPAEDFYAEKVLVESRYFETMGIALRAGRDFGAADTDSAPPVAIVSEQLARRLWPDGRAMGQRITMDSGPWMTIVGIAADVRQFGPQDAAPTMIYVPYQQNEKDFFLRSLTLVIRTRGGEPVAEPVRKVLLTIDPNLPVTRAASFDTLLAATIAEPRFRSTMLTAFAISAVSIAIVGIYGLLAYTIAQRRRELGVRLALGAAPSHIVRLVLRRVLTPVAGGLAAGLLLAGAMTRVLQGFLFEVRPTDAITLGGTTVLLALVAVGAIWLPARRAGRINPLETLRAE